MAKVLIINGSYRDAGISREFVDILYETLSACHHQVEIINLKEYNIRYCLNCRSCTQEEGDAPAKCVIDDDMQEIIYKIEESEGYVLISPTNFDTVTALYKAFLERLVPYGYWPWGEVAPKYRKEIKSKKSIVISSCAAPSVIGRFAFNTLKILKLTSKTIGAKVVDSLMIGLISHKENIAIDPKDKKRIIAIAKSLDRALVTS
jgi:multimeric flavodoxin WrbA